jgi:hypothetical protein
MIADQVSSTNEKYKKNMNGDKPETFIVTSVSSVLPW